MDDLDELEAFFASLDSSSAPPDEGERALLSAAPARQGGQWQAVGPSSNVLSVAYFPDSLRAGRGTVGVRFLNGGEYHYHGVEESTFRALLSARSPGSAHWDYFRRRGYPFTKVAAPRKNWRRTQP